MATFPKSVVGYGNDAIAITPADDTAITDSDGNVILPILYVGGAGNVVVKTPSGKTVTFTGVTAGTLLPLIVSSVQEATTATLIIGIYND